VGDKDRQVADNADAALFAIRLQLQPLFKEEVLKKLLRFHLLVQFFARRHQRRLIAKRQLLLPGIPGRSLVRLRQGAKQGVVIKPALGVSAKAFKILPLFGARRTVEVMEGFRQQRVFIVDDVAELHAVFVKGRFVLQIAGREQAVFDEPFEADHLRIAREGRIALVRGIAKAGRRER
jgi:hypothetical protein